MICEKCPLFCVAHLLVSEAACILSLEADGVPRTSVVARASCCGQGLCVLVNQELDSGGAELCA